MAKLNYNKTQQQKRIHQHGCISCKRNELEAWLVRCELWKLGRKGYRHATLVRTIAREQNKIPGNWANRS